MAARLLACLLLAALAPAGLGCFIFEELDKGQRIMEDPASGFEEEPREEASRDDSGSSAGGSGEEGGFDPDAWWKKVRTLAPGGESGGDGDGDDPEAVVRCRLDGADRFMRRGECLGRGGAPAG